MTRVKSKRRATAIDAYVGTRIRYARSMRGWTQSDLGSRLDMSYQQIQKYESGANRVGAGQLFRLSQVLEVPVAYFFEEMPKQVKGASHSRQLERSRNRAREQGKLLRWFNEIQDPKVRLSLIGVARAAAESSNLSSNRPSRH